MTVTRYSDELSPIIYNNKIYVTIKIGESLWNPFNNSQLYVILKESAFFFKN